jgi:hypothetical protein
MLWEKLTGQIKSMTMVRMDSSQDDPDSGNRRKRLGNLLSCVRSRGVNYSDHDIQGFAFLVLIVIASIFFLNGYQSVFGVDSFDESIYLTKAVAGAFETGWSPLYIFYYRILLNLFEGDVLFVYYLNLGILSSVVPVLHYLLLRGVLVSPLLSFLSAYYLLIASFGAPLIPKASHFNLMIMYVAFLAVSRLTQRILLYYFLLLLLIPTVFVRQDMIVVIAIMTVALGYMISRLSTNKSLILKKVLLGIVAIFGLHFFLFGNIFSSERSWPAFSSLYLYNSETSGPANAQALMESHFGKVQSIVEAYRANPSAIWQHIGRNFSKFPSYLADTLFYRYPVMRGNIESSLWLETVLIASIILFAIFGSLYLRWKQKKWRWWKKDEFTTAIFVVCFAVFIKTTLVVGFFWVGTARYFLEGIFAGTILFSIFLDRWTLIRIPSWMAYLLCLLLVAFVPRVKDCQDCWFPNTVSEENSAKELILQMKQLPGGICYYSGCFHTFFGPRFHCLSSGNSLDQTYPFPSKYQDLKSFLVAENVEYVLITESMKKVMADYGKEREFDHFLQNHRLYGYPWRKEVRPGEFVLSRNSLNQGN